MTLDAALAYARSHQPSILAALARVQAAEATRAIPGAMYLPRLSGAAEAFEATANNSTAPYLAAPGVDLPRIGATPVDGKSWNPHPGTLVALGLRQEVLDFGRTSALRALYDAQAQAERGRADAATLDVGFAIESAFFGVQAAKRVQGSAEAASARARTSRDAAAAGVKAGLRPPIDLTRAEADFARYEVSRLDAEQNVVAAQADLAAVVGVPDRLLDATGQLEEVRPTPTLDEALAEALQRDPLVRERLARAAAQRASTGVIRAELRPDVALTSTLTGRAGGAKPSSGPVPEGGGWQPNVPNWDVGLVLSIPLFDAAVLARERASAASEVARDREVDEARQALTARVQRAFVELDAARSALPALRGSLAAAQANYAQAHARFGAGLGTSVDLADAQALLADADVALAIGGFRASTARARLGRLTAESL